MIHQPTDEAAVCAVVRAERRVLPVAGGTKPALSQATGVTVVDLRRLTGVVDYEPTEYTFTARAGTTLREVEAMLAEHGQYLPFDPPLVRAGATLGGTVAAGMSGAGRLRYGGVRDFVIGVRWVDGCGRAVRGGGRVVKNAAGFDFPKLFCGSLGRLGILTELSFKVFPAPAARRTIEVTCGDLAGAAECAARLCGESWEVEAVEIFPGEGTVQVLARFMGDEPALAARTARVTAALGLPCRELTAAEATARWDELAALTFPGAGSVDPLVKVPVTLRRLEAFDAALSGLGAHRHYGMGGNQALVSTPDEEGLRRVLEAQGLSGVRLRGVGPPRIGVPAAAPMEERVARALDPDGKFVALTA